MQKPGIDSDRLFGNWELSSAKVEALAARNKVEETTAPVATVEVPPNWSALVREDPATARREQLRVRAEFQSALARGLVCSGFERAPAHPRYIFYSAEC